MPLPGRHNAMNALAAIATAQRFGFSQEEAARALADFSGVEMRLQRIEAGGVTIFNDAYNANPASVSAAADVLADIRGRRRVMIAGDMRELGPQARELHLQTGREIARRGLDLLIGVGEMGRYISVGAAEEGMASASFATLDAARGEAPSLLKQGDVILLKGSRAMGMETLIDPIRRAFGDAQGASPEPAQKQGPTR
jgi:UDP-N-acetylmuramoyl-tripeptide--D-alanyl-D-alanine ligase